MAWLRAIHANRRDRRRVPVGGGEQGPGGRLAEEYSAAGGDDGESLGFISSRSQSRAGTARSGAVCRPFTLNSADDLTAKNAKKDSYEWMAYGFPSPGGWISSLARKHHKLTSLRSLRSLRLIPSAVSRFTGLCPDVRRYLPRSSSSHFGPVTSRRVSSPGDPISSIVRIAGRAAAELRGGASALTLQSSSTTASVTSAVTPGDTIRRGWLHFFRIRVMSHFLSSYEHSIEQIALCRCVMLMLFHFEAITKSPAVSRKFHWCKP